MVVPQVKNEQNIRSADLLHQHVVKKATTAKNQNKGEKDENHKNTVKTNY